MEPWLKETLKPPGRFSYTNRTLVAKVSLGQILRVTGFWVTWLTKDVIAFQPARDLNLFYSLASCQLTPNLKLWALIRA